MYGAWPTIVSGNRRPDSHLLQSATIARLERHLLNYPAGRGNWWTLPGSNWRHPACRAGALPTELKARIWRRLTPGNEGQISDLIIAPRRSAKPASVDVRPPRWHDEAGPSLLEGIQIDSVDGTRTRIARCSPSSPGLPFSARPDGFQSVANRTPMSRLFLPLKYHGLSSPCAHDEEIGAGCGSRTRLDSLEGYCTRPICQARIFTTKSLIPYPQIATASVDMETPSEFGSGMPTRTASSGL